VVTSSACISRRSTENPGLLDRFAPIALALLALLCATPGSAAGPSADFGAGCAAGNAVPDYLEQGGHLGYAVGFENPTDNPVTFKVQLAPNAIFRKSSPTQLFLQTLPPHTGVNLRPFSLTIPMDAPFISDRLTLEVTTSPAFATPIASCVHVVLVITPDMLAAPNDVIQVPIRFIVLEGSPQARGKQAGTTTGDATLFTALQRINQDLLPSARMLYYAVAAPQGIPVIADDVIAGGIPGSPRPADKGDLCLDNRGLSFNGESQDDWKEGNQAWMTLYPSLDPLPGIAVLNYRSMPCTETIGATLNMKIRSFEHDLGYMCNSPRSFRASDLPGFTTISDPEYCPHTSAKCMSVPDGGFDGVTIGVRTLAHELGHALSLFHGNGADDDLDSAYPPNPGPRSYDGDGVSPSCDGDEVEPTGPGTVVYPPGHGPPSALMVGGGTSTWKNCPSCPLVSRLQAEQMRDAAAVVPGSSQGIVPGPMESGRRAGSVHGVQRDEELGTSSSACGLSPVNVNPGGTVALSASGLLPGQPAEVFLGTRLVGHGVVGASGDLTTEFVVPSGTPQGLGAVAVRVGGASTSVACPLQVLGPAITPATRAVVDPQPTLSGWWNSDVKISLKAEDVLGGPGIASMTYRADGANPIAETAAPGAEANAVVSSEGLTAFSFFATGVAGGVENPNTLDLRIDRTPPRVEYFGNLGEYGILDDVSIGCAAQDDLSGVASSTCADISGPGYLFAAGENTFSAQATDFAGNLGSGATRFNLVVRFEDLCALSRQFIDLPSSEHTNRMCAQLDAARAAAARGNAVACANIIDAYNHTVDAAARSGHLATKEAAILRRLSAALPRRGTQPIATREGRASDREPGATQVATDSGSAPASAALAAGVPTDFHFAAPAPNPGSGPFRLWFGVPSSARVTIDVFATNGARIRALANGVEGPGVHQIDWDGRDGAGRPVESGIYFVKLTVGARSMTRSVVVAR